MEICTREVLNRNGDNWTDSGHILEVNTTDLVDGLGMGNNEGSSEGGEGIKYDF